MGVVIALGVLCLWAAHLVYCLSSWGPTVQTWGWIPLHALLQAYLFTGLFITAHDAMHGTVSGRRWLNRALGTVASFLFAGMSYRRLVRNHAKHHAHPTGAEDPDYFGTGSGGFVRWWLGFMWRYTTLAQIVIMAVAYNLLAHGVHVPEWKLLAFWVGPALLGTLQLFYFGTYLPHRPPSTDAMAPHHARSQARGHAWAMLTCYFFGYHWEHHESPGTPWWRLFRARDARKGF